MTADPGYMASRISAFSGTLAESISQADEVAEASGTAQTMLADTVGDASTRVTRVANQVAEISQSITSLADDEVPAMEVRVDEVSAAAHAASERATHASQVVARHREQWESRLAQAQARAEQLTHGLATAKGADAQRLRAELAHVRQLISCRRAAVEASRKASGIAAVAGQLAGSATQQAATSRTHHQSARTAADAAVAAARNAESDAQRGQQAVMDAGDAAGFAQQARQRVSDGARRFHDLGLAGDGALADAADRLRELDRGLE